METNLAVIRHGEAKYENLLQPQRGTYDIDSFLQEFALIKDLKESSLEGLSLYLDSFIKDKLDILRSKKRIDIWVSPFGRTIETAYILLNQLKKNGIGVEKVCLFSKLGEVGNFHWPVFSSMVNGGKVTISGKEINFDKSVTNPDGLSYSEYFFQSYWMKIDISYLNGLGILDNIRSIETYDNVTQRSKNALSRVLNFVGEDKMAVVVSHQAFTDWIIKNGENYEKGGQLPGEVLVLNQDLIDNGKSYERFERKV